MITPKMLIMTNKLTAFSIWGSFLSLTNSVAYSLIGGALSAVLFNT